MELEIVAGVLTLFSAVPYLRDTMRGTTKPQRTSWFVFAVVAIVAAAGQLANSSSAGAILAIGSAVGVTAIAVASISHGVGGDTSGDRQALLTLMIGLLLWAITNRPIIAVAVAILVDTPALLLTLRKAATDPKSETLSMWVVDGAAGFVTIAAASSLGTHHLLYPAYHAISNLAVSVAILRGQIRLPRRTSAHSR